jgi:hypothetical protein
MALPSNTTKLSAGGLKFTVKSRITEQLIKLELDTEYFVRFDSEFFKAKKNGASRNPTAGAVQKEPPYLAKITMLDDGSQGVMIVPQVLRTEIEDYFPEQAYKGLMFRIVRHKLEGKDFNTFDIAEIETDGELEELPNENGHGGIDDGISADFNEDAGLDAPDHGVTEHKKGKKK